VLALVRKYEQKQITSYDDSVNCSSSWVLNLTAWNGTEFDLRSYYTSYMTMSLEARSDNCSFFFSANGGYIPDVHYAQYLLPIAGLLSCIFSGRSVLMFYTKFEVYFMQSISYIPLILLSIIYFQLFGLLITMGLSMSSSYLQEMTIAGVGCFFACISCNNLSYILFMTKNSSHPEINSRSFRSPRVKFYLWLILSQVIFYFGSFYLMRYPIFSQYFVMFYMYPLIHIITCIRTSKRNTYRS